MVAAARDSRFFDEAGYQNPMGHGSCELGSRWRETNHIRCVKPNLTGETWRHRRHKALKRGWFSRVLAPKDELHPAGVIVGITESKVEDLWALSTRRGACLA